MTSKPQMRVGSGCACSNWRVVAILAGFMWLWPGVRQAAAQPIDALSSWEGAMDYFATGAPLAVPTTSNPSNVSTLNQPASIQVTALDVPVSATVVAAYVYWAGSILDQSDCANAPLNIDDQVVVTLPGAAFGILVTADECFCAPGASSYDIQACRVDLTSQVVTSGMIGTFTVDQFTCKATGGSTDNASFSVVLVYEEPALLPPRRITLYDGLEELYQSSRTIQLAGLDVDTPAQGELTWYVLDGDIGGSTGSEQVSVQGSPGGLSVVLSDAINPADNPMNRTINTTTPPQTGVVGVDIDRLDLSAGLTPGDVAVDVTLTAENDKFWVVYGLVGVNVFTALIHPKTSTKEWVLEVDADASGNVTPGDTIRYTIHLHNVGTAPGYLTLTDVIPPEAASWVLVDGAGGTDQSTATELVLVDIFVAAGSSVDVVLDVVVAAGTAGLSMDNVAEFDAGPDGNAGEVNAASVAIHGGSAPDAGVVDAQVTVGDGQTPTPDSAVFDYDSLPGVDAGPPGSGRHAGCSCRAGDGPAPAWLFFLLVVGLFIRRRRFRRS